MAQLGMQINTHSSEENNEQVRDIVKQQLTAWYFLHHILTTRWKDVFSRWSTPLLEIDRKLRSSHTFLQVTYDQIKSEVEARKKEGDIFQCCPSCGFESHHYEADQKVVYEASCLVCGLTEKALKIGCASCGEKVTFINEGFGQCDSCGVSFEPVDLAAELIDEGAAHIAAMEADSSWDLGNCSDCDGYQTVVRTKDDFYLCTSCFLMLDNLQSCGWCNEPNTGDMEHSSWAGCNHCDGRAGWEKDD
jgi:hypothetical protein